MRRTATLVIALIVASTFAPPPANADGGAYLEFDRTYYLPGEMARVEAYVRVPRRKLSLFDRGPFLVFAVPKGSSLVEGRPIPAGAVRLATLEIDREGRDQELSARFRVPDLGWGYHQVEVCNEPCTLAGFREPLTGGFSVVATARERTLIRENGRLTSRAFLLRRRVRKAERRIEDLQRRLEWGSSDRERLAARIDELERTLTAARADLAERSRRLPIDVWQVAGLLLLAILAAAAALRARRERSSGLRPAGVEPGTAEVGGGGSDHRSLLRGRTSLHRREQTRARQDRLAPVRSELLGQEDQVAAEAQREVGGGDVLVEPFAWIGNGSERLDGVDRRSDHGSLPRARRDEARDQ
jgi:hypothetical protein